jgi:hypothetical protein
VVAGLPLVRRIALAARRAGFGRIVVHGLRVDSTLSGIPADRLDRAESELPGSRRRFVLLPSNVVPQADWLRASLSTTPIFALLCLWARATRRTS